MNLFHPRYPFLNHNFSVSYTSVRLCFSFWKPNYERKRQSRGFVHTDALDGSQQSMWRLLGTFWKNWWGCAEGGASRLKAWQLASVRKSVSHGWEIWDFETFLLVSLTQMSKKKPQHFFTHSDREIKAFSVGKCWCPCSHLPSVCPCIKLSCSCRDKNGLQAISEAWFDAFDITGKIYFWI